MGRVLPDLYVDSRLSGIEVAILTPNAITPLGWNKNAKLVPLIPDVLVQHRRSADPTISIASNAGVQAKELLLVNY